VKEQHYRQQLASSCKRLSLDASEAQLDLLLGYHQLLVKWNKAYNLTAIRDPDEMIDRHLVDSLSIVPYLTGQRLLDVGSGGGMPGVIIAIMKPQLSVTLLDSNSKKTRFLNQVKIELKLANLSVEHTRLEAYQPEMPHDCITSRAFTTLQDMVEKSASCCETGGLFLAMKGVYPTQELAELDQLDQISVSVEQIYPLQVPGADGERHLVVLKRQ